MLTLPLQVLVVRLAAAAYGVRMSNRGCNGVLNSTGSVFTYSANLMDTGVAWDKNPGTSPVVSVGESGASRRQLHSVQPRAFPTRAVVGCSSRSTGASGSAATGLPRAQRCLPAT